jgi:aspartyl-tRNA(Asn)/glutamyl-tRNA(Gln) amidotransferase subunit B
MAGPRTPRLCTFATMMFRGYEAVIGLEIHAQLSTASKIFSSDAVGFAGAPNTRISPLSLGLPGVLPVLNQRAVELAILMGLATHCQIAEHCHFARKNYFYPDLPKGYQISQDNTPICRGGYLAIRTGERGEKQHVGITRIHLEEDAGKSLHDQDPFESLIDLNRAGVGLIEIVSEPDMRTPEQAAAYVGEVRKLVRYLGVCDGNMEEGNLRVDVNVSVRKPGTPLGTRTETKNVNSISNVSKAIAYEIDRQINLLEAGEAVQQQTRTWDAVAGKTTLLRDKETADDYRYFAEPDLQPLHIGPDLLERLRAQLPSLPEALYTRYTQELGLSDFDAGLLTEGKTYSDYYEAVLQHTENPRAAANWMNGPIKSYLNEYAIELEAFPLSPETLGQLIHLIDAGKISHSAAKDQLWPALLQQPSAAPDALATEMDLLLETNTAQLTVMIAEVLTQNPDKVAAYRSGKTGLLGFFVGQIMRASGGKADPKVINELILQSLAEDQPV